MNAVARAGDSVYLGGKFQGLARHAPGLAAFEPVSGELQAPTTRLDQLGTAAVAVTAITDAPDGGVYVAGTFAGAGGVQQPRLLRFGPSGALDPTFAPSVPDSRILDMDVGANGVLYLAGTFTTVGGENRTRLAAVSAATGAVVTGWQPVTDGSVTQLEAGPTAVYLGGEFTKVGVENRSRAAAVRLDNGAVLAWQPNTDGAVRALALAPDGLTTYLGGDFTTVGGAARLRLAAVDATGTGTPRAWNPAPSAPVTRIAVSGTRVFVAGSFIRIGAQTPQPSRRFLAAIDAAGNALPWDPAASREPSDLAVDTGRVYLSWRGDVGRPLPTVAGQVRCGLASVDADSGQATPWNPSVEDGGPSGSSCNPELGYYRSGPAALAVAGGRVWAGGSFTVANIRRRSGLAALDARTGQPLAWAPRLPGASPFGADVVHDLAVAPDGATVYVGGSLSTVNDQTRRNAVALTASGTADSVADVRPLWNPAPNNVVRALALSPDGRLVYLGGDFGQAGGDARPRLAAVDAATGRTAGPRLPSPSGPVLDLLVDPDPATERLFVAGQFGTIDRSTDPALPDLVPRAGLAAVGVATTLTAPQVLPWNAALTAGAVVEALALRGSQIVAGGRFATSAGPANLGAFDRATATPAPWTPQVNDRVSTVTIDPADGTAYVTGAFSTVGDRPRAGAAAVGVDGAPTGWDPAPGSDYPLSDADRLVPPGGVLLLDDRLLLTGRFTVIGGRPQTGFALFGPTTAPVAVRPPSISGAAEFGRPPINCVAAVWAGGGGTLTVAWLRNGVPIPEATGRIYRIAAPDRGRELRCRETMTNAAGDVMQLSAPVTVRGVAPELDSPPTVAGQPWVGGTARCTTGLWRNAPATYSFRWLLDGVSILAAASATYDVTAAEQGRALACEVTAENEYGTSAPARSADVTITEAPPAALGSPLIAGDPRVGSRLTCEPGAWERARGFAYQWLRDRVPLVDAVAPTYVATSRDLGRSLTCLVSAGNAGGTTSAESFAVVVVASARSTGTGRRANPGDDAATSASSRRRKVEIRSVRLRSGRVLAVTVSTPAAGRISVTVVRAAPAKAGARKTAALARGSRTARRAASVTLQVKLSAIARRLVARAGRRGLRVTVRVSFRPATGAASSDRTTRTLATRAARR